MALKAAHLQQGQRAEQQACNYLMQQGLKLVTRNYRSPYGEIDLIMQDKNALVFVEVRYRKNIKHGLPEETVTYPKQRRLRATAEHYLQQTIKHGDIACRFDIVAYSGHLDDHHVNWIQNALI